MYGVQKNYNYHGELWDMLHAANITVMAGFDIYGQFLADRSVTERGTGTSASTVVHNLPHSTTT